MRRQRLPGERLLAVIRTGQAEHAGNRMRRGRPFRDQHQKGNRRVVVRIELPLFEPVTVAFLPPKPDRRRLRRELRHSQKLAKLRFHPLLVAGETLPGQLLRQRQFRFQPPQKLHVGGHRRNEPAVGPAGRKIFLVTQHRFLFLNQNCGCNITMRPSVYKFSHFTAQVPRDCRRRSPWK